MTSDDGMVGDPRQGSSGSVGSTLWSDILVTGTIPLASCVNFRVRPDRLRDQVLSWQKQKCHSPAREVACGAEHLMWRLLGGPARLWRGCGQSKVSIVRVSQLSTP
jgi:hypothetical protein